MNDMTLNSICTRIGRDLRHLRMQKGLSQTVAANMVGSTRQTVSRIETGDMNVSMGTIVALAKAYEAPASFLSVLGVSPVKPVKKTKETRAPREEMAPEF